MGFQNIELVSHYSKSVSSENSKCVDFVLVQSTPIVQKGPISSSCCKISNLRKWHIWLLFEEMAYQRLPDYPIICHYSKLVARKNLKCLDFVLVQATRTVEKSPISLSCYTKSKTDSYSTQWLTKGFENIKLISYYSKSMSRKNSTCLDFVLVQVTHIVQKSTISASWYTGSKNDSYSTISLSSYTRSKNVCYSGKFHTMGFQNIKLIFHYSKSVSHKYSKCLDFVLLQLTPIVEKGHNFSFVLQKIKNDCHSTEWPSNGFQNIKLVSHYSKSVGRKNSKCVDFVLVQLIPIVQKGPISPSCCKRSKNNSYSRKWHTKGFQNIQLFPIIQSQWPVKIPNVLSLCWYK